MNPEKDGNNSTIIDHTYTLLNDRHDAIYQFVMHYNDYIYSVHSYAETELSMIEVHTLSYIEDHPGCNSNDLIQYWDKTKGLISQMLSRLERLGLIKKEKKEGNAKNVYLYVTEEGTRVSKAHKMYDIVDITKTMSELQKECSAEEIESFYHVLSVYNKVIKNDFEINSRKRNSRKKDASNM
ncbi:MAG: MarR family winged helix-turn-helix transcriptional regulator [Clostridiales bacterium]|nr:MarR family winged helix-turn-helix transcriptional regulator [Clostridiales bacterium]